MCLYPRIIKNKRYEMYNLKKGDTPIDDIRKKYVAIGCGNCIECRKQKAREWQVRLNEELKDHKHNYFITLTFSCEELNKLCEENPDIKDNVNKVASIAVRRFLERWRKKHKKSIRHWLITELGHENTERIHLHGILFCEEPLTNEELQTLWKYGITDTGQYCNERTINYIIKYVTKIDTYHKGYVADIFCSSGLGARYLRDENNLTKHRFNGKNTIQYYTLKNGQKVALPKYYRNKLWTEKERGQLWTNILDADKTYVKGIEIKQLSGIGYQTYMRILKEQQQINRQMGFGTAEKEWREKEYKITFEMLNGK